MTNDEGLRIELTEGSRETRNPTGETPVSSRERMSLATVERLHRLLGGEVQMEKTILRSIAATARGLIYLLLVPRHGDTENGNRMKTKKVGRQMIQFPVFQPPNRLMLS